MSGRPCRVFSKGPTWEWTLNEGRTLLLGRAGEIVLAGRWAWQSPSVPCPPLAKMFSEGLSLLVIHWNIFFRSCYCLSLQPHYLKPGQTGTSIDESRRFHTQGCKGNPDDWRDCYEGFLSNSGFSGVKPADDVALSKTGAVPSKCFTGSGWAWWFGSSQVTWLFRIENQGIFKRWSLGNLWVGGQGRVKDLRSHSYEHKSSWVLTIFCVTMF